MIKLGRIAFIFVILMAFEYCESLEEMKGFEYCKPFSQTEKVPQFQDGNFYVYQFKGRQSTGIQMDAFHQYTGVEMSGNLVVQNFRGNVYMKVANEKSQKFNQKFNNSFEEINEESEEKIDKILTNPFGVDYDEGVIQSIHFFSDQSHPKNQLEQNLQRGIASAFQLHLHPEKTDVAQSYIFVEKGIGGECPVHYEIFPVENDTQRLIITKTPLYDRCEHKAQLMFSSIDGQSYTNSNQTFLKRSSKLTYRIKLKGYHKFVIENIDIVGKMIINPFNEENQVVALTNQTYVLIRTDSTKPTNMHNKDTQTKSPIYEANKNKRNLNEINLKEAHHFNRFYDLTESTTIHQAVNLLSKVSINASSFKEQPVLALKLIKEFSRFNYEDFSKFFKLHVKYKFIRYEEKKALWIFLKEILSYVGTNPAIMYIKHLIEMDQTCSSQWIPILANIPPYAKEPSQYLIEEIWDLLTKINQKCKPEVYEAALLAFGFLLNKGCVRSPFNPRPYLSFTYIEEATCLRYLNKLIENAENTLGSLQLDSPYMAAIKNTRMEETFPFFAKIIASSPVHYSVEHRRFAIEAMTNFIPGKSLEVFTIIAPVFYNHKEDYSLRVAAFNILLLSLPTIETLDSIIEAFKKEPYMKVRSYVYRSMAALAHSDYPCYSHLTVLAQEFLKSVIVPDDDILRYGTKIILFSDRGVNNSYSNILEFSALGSNVSSLPREVCVRMGFCLSGYDFNVVKFTKFNRGSSFLPQMLREHPSFADGGISNLKTFKLSSYRRKSLIDDWIKIPKMYEEIYNQHIPYFDSDDDDVQIVPNFMTRSIDHKLFQKKTFYHNVEYTIPTETGWPVTFSFEYIRLIQTKALLAQKIPKLSSYNAIVGDLEIFQGDMDIVQMAVDIDKDGVYHHGINLNSRRIFHLPLKGSLSLTPAFTQLKFAVKIPQETTEIFNRNSDIATIGIGGTRLELRFQENLFEETKKFGHEYFGAGLTFHNIYDADKSVENFEASLFQDLIEGNAENIKKLFFDLIIFSHPVDLKFSSYSVRLEPNEIYPSTEFTLTVNLKNISSFNASDSGIWSMKNFDIELEGKGESDRRWSIHLDTKKSWPDNRMTLINFLFSRSPIPDVDNETLEVCFQYNSTASDYQAIFQDILGFHQPRIDFSSVLQFGKECEAEESGKVDIKGFGESSDEQKSLDRMNLPMYKKCKKYLTDKFPYHPSCREVIKDQGRLDRLTVDVSLNNESTIVAIDALNQAQSYFYSIFDDDIRNESEPTTIENDFQISGNISYFDYLLDVQFASIEREIRYDNISLLELLPSFKPYTVTEDNTIEYLKRAINYHDPVCLMSGKYIKTTDDLIYHMEPKDECFYVLLGDCSEDTLTVLVKNMKNGKIVIVIVDDKYVLLSFSDGMMNVRAMHRSILSELSPPYYENDTYLITRFGDQILMNIKTANVKLLFDGKNLELKIRNSLRGKQCGLCGDFDGEIVNEFVALNGTATENLEEFTKSYEFCNLCENTLKHQRFCTWFRQITKYF